MEGKKIKREEGEEEDKRVLRIFDLEMLFNLWLTGRTNDLKWYGKRGNFTHIVKALLSVLVNFALKWP